MTGGVLGERMEFGLSPQRPREPAGVAFLALTCPRKRRRRGCVRIRIGAQLPRARLIAVVGTGVGAGDWPILTGPTGIQRRGGDRLCKAYGAQQQDER